MNRYVTRAHLEDVRVRLTATDWSIIDSLRQFHLLSGQQLRRLHIPGEEESQRRSARRRLRHLTDLRLIARLDRRIGGVRAGSDGYVYRLDVAGRRLLGLSRGRYPYTPGRLFLSHRLAVSDLYVQLVEALRDRPEIKLVGFDVEPACWRRFPSGGQVLKPDAFVQLSAALFDDFFYLEVDCATESTATLRRKMDAYRAWYQTGRDQHQLTVYPRVLWIVPNEARKAILVELAAQQPADTWRLHQVIRSSEAVGTMLGERP